MYHSKFKKFNALAVIILPILLAGCLKTTQDQNNSSYELDLDSEPIVNSQQEGFESVTTICAENIETKKKKCNPRIAEDPNDILEPGNYFFFEERRNGDPKKAERSYFSKASDCSGNEAECSSKAPQVINVSSQTSSEDFTPFDNQTNYIEDRKILLVFSDQYEFTSDHPVNKIYSQNEFQITIIIDEQNRFFEREHEEISSGTFLEQTSRISSKPTDQSKYLEENFSQTKSYYLPDKVILFRIAYSNESGLEKAENLLNSVHWRTELN